MITVNRAKSSRDRYHAALLALMAAASHTFTEVEEFGGGFIEILNTLSGNPVAAPECLAVGSLTFIATGDRVSEAIEESGTELYQCCLHPWMRAVVNAR